MSDQMRQLSDIKWQATGVDGHTHHTCDTSDAPPVEADEYERMKQRAEAAEKRIKELEAAFAAIPMGEITIAVANITPDFDELRRCRRVIRDWQDVLLRSRV